MWRCLLRRSQLSLAFYTSHTKLNFPMHQLKQQLLKQSLQVTTQLHLKNLTLNHSKDKEAVNDSSTTTDPFPFENDGEYIIGYELEHEERLSSAEITKGLMSSALQMTEDEVNKVLNDETFVESYREASVLFNMQELINAGVNKRSILDYPWLLSMRTSILRDNLTSIQKLLWVRNINDFIVFMRLTKPRLKKLVMSLNSESIYVPEKNRLYYISKMLNTDPYVVAKYLSKRLFVLEMPFELMEMHLHHMLDYKVDPTSILRDLWAFRYRPRAVQQRFERATNAKKNKIMPWMVRCPERILQRSLNNSLSQMAVLGDKKDAVEYVAERLNFSVEATRTIMEKHPSTFSVRVTKIKEVLDYLLNEAGFTRFEIAQNPRILCHSLETTKHRFDELKSLGCRPSTLVILCRSKREYKKFVNKWTDTKLEHKGDGKKEIAAAQITKTTDKNEIEAEADSGSSSKA